ncbi:hypothetical protein BD408DRAFT_410435 [Parasitella parasitica]|nr:hypothetical protein BD408DRAFT_410435 [Parasitella parasitica]
MNQPAALPLTEKHLLSLSSNNNEMLERYCKEITTHRERCQSTPPRLMLPQQKNNDVVVASPRLLPFPYHNDSMFLPTAEQMQYQKSSGYATTTYSGTSRADSSSSSVPPSPLLMPRLKRPQSTATAPNMRGSSNYSISLFSHHRERRSLPARLDSFVKANRFARYRFLRRSTSGSSFDSSSVSSLEIAEDNDAPQQYNDSNTKKPWLKRIFKFFNKTNQTQQQQQELQNHHHDGNPVWYCQYSKNPTSRFEKYYNQKQMIIVS